MKLLTILLILPALASAQPIDPYEDTDPGQLQQLYSSMRAQIDAKRKALARSYAAGEVTSTETDSCLTTWLANDIWPFWMGTTWDFNGYSAKPREGEIACGYFVSTTLKHIGVNVNRYKLAQQYSLKIVELLCGEANVRKTGDAEDCVSIVSGSPDGIWVVGLSNHVGFLLKRNGQVWFVHSSYMEPVAVTRESALESEPFMYSSVYVMGRLTGNSFFVERWLRGEGF